MMQYFRPLMDKPWYSATSIRAQSPLAMDISASWAGSIAKVYPTTTGSALLIFALVITCGYGVPIILNMSISCLMDTNPSDSISANELSRDDCRLAAPKYLVGPFQTLQL